MSLIHLHLSGLPRECITAISPLHTSFQSSLISTVNLATTSYGDINTNAHIPTKMTAWSYNPTDFCTCPTDSCTCWAATHVCFVQYFWLPSCRVRYICVHIWNCGVWACLWCQICIGVLLLYTTLLFCVWVCHCPSNCVGQVTVCWCAWTWHCCSTARCSREG